MTGVPRRFPSQPCPICARWTCARCHRVNHRADSRLPQRCSRCGSTEGELVPVTHYNEDTHLAHVDCHRLEDSVAPVDLDRVIVNATLVELISPLIESYRRYRRLSSAIATGSREWNRAVNLAHQELSKIESTVRSWTAQHPEGRS